MIPVDDLVSISALIPYPHGDLLSAVDEQGVLELEEHTAHGVHITARVSAWLAGRLCRGLVLSDNTESESGE